MFTINSIAGRIAVAKCTGLVIAIVALLTLPLVPVETTIEFKIGFVLLIMLMSVMIGFIGVFDEHPMISVKMPWWIRGPLVGGFFLLLFVLLAGTSLEPFMKLEIIASLGFESPYWAVLDGVFIGGIIAFITTKIAGEGNLPIK
jgi:hypothetical protein